MDTADRILLTELCEKLSSGSWDEAEIATAAKEIELAIDHPDTYVSEHPDAAWIVEECQTGWIASAFSPEEAQLEYQRLVKEWAILGIFLSVGVYGDKADEIVEQVIDLFEDLELELPPLPVAKHGYEWYEPFLNAAIAEIQPEKGGFRLIYLSQSFDESLYLVAVYRPDVDRIIEISNRFEFKISTSCWGNSIGDHLHLPTEED
ncbi:hypothetical protein [Chamaesiphon sp. OTE_75_metabat_556]|uniref:hypothetical protein n=1 Tax=Chamaesiphon sp. OTE_75_metabat_556 TaxID=2964692 RepID=UPI00286BFAE1|nr:hypothetical protein [Chamaesiphon sp. OTE_75_metabat_556]